MQSSVRQQEWSRWPDHCTTASAERLAEEALPHSRELRNVLLTPAQGQGTQARSFTPLHRPNLISLSHCSSTFLLLHVILYRQQQSCPLTSALYRAVCHGKCLFGPSACNCSQLNPV